MSGAPGMNFGSQQQSQYANFEQRQNGPGNTTLTNSPGQPMDGKKPTDGHTTPTNSPRQNAGKQADGDSAVMDLVTDAAGNVITDSPPRKSKRRGGGTED